MCDELCRRNNIFGIWRHITYLYPWDSIFRRGQEIPNWSRRCTPTYIHDFAHLFPVDFVTITPQSSYAYLLVIIGPAAAGGGIECEQQITIILVLLLACLQLRLQLRCIIREAVEYFHDLLLHLHRRHGYTKIKNPPFVSARHFRTLRVLIMKIGKPVVCQ